MNPSYLAHSMDDLLADLVQTTAFGDAHARVNAVFDKLHSTIKEALADLEIEPLVKASTLSTMTARIQVAGAVVQSLGNLANTVTTALTLFQCAWAKREARRSKRRRD